MKEWLSVVRRRSSVIIDSNGRLRQNHPVSTKLSTGDNTNRDTNIELSHSSAFVRVRPRPIKE
ncbi:MAG: hypothetical protein H6668_07795 [Ardenticatenaceae bacterium]|nr:hypothetical protein [Ardenticatenaceae bacterium]